MRELLQTQGHGRVLVVDGGGSMRCALLGDMLAELAIKNNWTGLVIYGCIRDSVVIKQLPLGVKALGTIPLKSVKLGVGQRDIDLHFHGITFSPNHFIYCDPDGIITSQINLIE